MIILRHLVLASTLPALLLVGCGNGETSSEEPTEVAQTANDAQVYCSLSAELDAREGPPSEEQLAEIEAAAPPEIAEQVAILVEAVRSEDFSNPDIEEADAELLAWEDENCVESFEVEPGEPGAEATDASSP